RLALTGQISAESVNGRMPERPAVPLRDVSLAIEHDAVLDMTNEHAALQRIALTLQEMTLEGSGTLDAWSAPERRRLSLQLSTGDTELDPLLASLPASMRSWPQNAAAGQEWTAAAGSARIEATVDGRLGGGEVPTVDGSLTLSGIALSRGGEP